MRGPLETPEAEVAEVVEVEKEVEGEEGLEGEKREEGTEEAGGVREAEKPLAKQPVPQATVPKKDPLMQQIEHVMEEDVTDTFLKMTPKEQQTFKQTGEETASKIRVLVEKTKINARKILDLLKRWLKLIPGVNQFFLEQEAKIKTDKILLLAEEERKKGGDTLS